MGLFTLLFGVGVVLLAEKREAKGQKVGWGHYSRMLWLFAIGALHYWYVWEGDVLTLYAMIGLVVYPIHKLSIKMILGISCLGFVLSICLFHVSNLDEESLHGGSYSELLAFYSPTQEQMEQEIAEKKGTYEDVMRSARSGFSEDYIEDTNTENGGDVIARIGFAMVVKTFSIMCLGMVLYKSGFILGAWPAHRYLTVMKLCLIFGFVLSTFSLFWSYIHDWATTTYFSISMALSAVGAMFVTLAYATLFILIVQKNILEQWVTRISKVGQMAMTNYLMQSVFCAFVFYGHGLGLFGALSRLELLPIVVMIWILQIHFSNFWLSRFTQGPMEWLWRTLSYYSVQPLRRHKEH